MKRYLPAPVSHGEEERLKEHWEGVTVAVTVRSRKWTMDPPSWSLASEEEREKKQEETTRGEEIGGELRNLVILIFYLKISK